LLTMRNALLMSVRLVRSVPVDVSSAPVALTPLVNSENALKTPSIVSGPKLRLVDEGAGDGEALAVEAGAGEAVAFGAGVGESARALPEAIAITSRQSPLVRRRLCVNIVPIVTAKAQVCHPSNG
jgi:hypothetical protein